MDCRIKILNSLLHKPMRVWLYFQNIIKLIEEFLQLYELYPSVHGLVGRRIVWRNRLAFTQTIRFEA
jgi:hypothetical protein